MEKTSIERLLDDYLQGLVLPVESSSLSLFAWLVIIALLVLLFIALWKWLNHQKQAKQKAIRQLKNLQHKYQRNKKRPTQTTAIELSRILRKGLSLPRLSCFKPQKVDDWEGFLKNLNAACYSNQAVSRIEIESLIKKSQHWLTET